MKREEILEFCGRWLPAWEGNKPDDLIEFYSDDALYIDPANKKGLKGRDRIFAYFKKLLSAYPSWKWEAIQVFPTDLGFVAKWKATIPVRAETITEHGMDIVEIERGKISRNEVYFDLSQIFEALRKP
jgi:ketosteroid isomerase-like protein